MLTIYSDQRSLDQVIYDNDLTEIKKRMVFFYGRWDYYFFIHRVFINAANERNRELFDFAYEHLPIKYYKYYGVFVFGKSVDWLITRGYNDMSKVGLRGSYNICYQLRLNPITEVVGKMDLIENKWTCLLARIFDNYGIYADLAREVWGFIMHAKAIYGSE